MFAVWTETPSVGSLHTWWCTCVLTCDDGNVDGHLFRDLLPPPLLHHTQLSSSEHKMSTRWVQDQHTTRTSRSKESQRLVPPTHAVLIVMSGDSCSMLCTWGCVLGWRRLWPFRPHIPPLSGSVWGATGSGPHSAGENGCTQQLMMHLHSPHPWGCTWYCISHSMYAAPNWVCTLYIYTVSYSIMLELHRTVAKQTHHSHSL